MNKRLEKIMQSYFINKRIHNLFPEANDYVYLSSVFPEKFKNSDKIVPVKYDKHGSIEKIFEERDFSGSVETEIVPIEYHSSYALGIAEVVKSLILDNLEFCKIFLAGYDKIVVDSNGVSDDNVFVIDNFTNDFSYTIEDFVNSVLDNYCVDSQYRDLLIPKIINSFCVDDKDELINYHFYLNSHGDEEVDFSCLVDLFLINKDYEVLRVLLETGNILEARGKYIEKNCFKIINEIISSSNYVPSFYVKYIDLLTTVMESISKNNGESTEKKKISLQKVEKNSTLNLVRFLLKEFDSTGKFSEVFERAILKKDILLWHKGEKENTDNKKDIFIVFELTGTIYDTVRLVGEFIRYYICKNGMNDEQNYILGLLPSYYEEKTKEWLTSNGFSSSEVTNSSNDLLSNDVLMVLSLIQMKNNTGEISSNNLDSKKAVSCAKLLLKSPVLKESESISKALGKYISSNFKSDDMDQRMLSVMESISNNGSDSDDMMTVIVTGMNSLKANESVIQYVKIKVPPMVVSS